MNTADLSFLALRGNQFISKITFLVIFVKLWKFIIIVFTYFCVIVTPAEFMNVKSTGSIPRDRGFFCCVGFGCFVLFFFNMGI